MARLLPIEDCNECSYRLDDEYAIQQYCGAEPDPEHPHEYRVIPKHRLTMPNWCPLEEERRWIPVGERIPERLDWYPIVQVLEDGRRVVAVCEWVGDGWSEYAEPTHWLDIPPLPEEATDEDRR